MKIATKADVEWRGVESLLIEAGVDANGDAQQFHTANVLRYMLHHMPHLTGVTEKLTIAQTDVRVPEIVTEEPQAEYLFNGVAMEGTPRTPTDRPLNYTKTYNPMAGPRWDEAVSAHDGEALAADLQRYIDTRGGGHL